VDDGWIEVAVAVEAGELAARVRGEGEPVMLLHGGPGLSDYLDPLADELADGHTVARYQQRGLPPSTAREPYDVPVQVADAVAVLDRLGWDRAVVVGHSWGGHLVLHLIASHPDRVRAALVVDPIGGVGDGGLSDFGAAMLRRTPEAVRGRVAEIGQREEAGLASDEESLESLRLVWPAYFADPDRPAPFPRLELSGDAYAQTFASLQALLPGLSGRLAGCRVPTRFVHGAESPMPVTASADTAMLIGAEVDLVDGAGHLPWWEAPGVVRRSLEDLLGQLPTP
jgi:proline iminopeptidase